MKKIAIYNDAGVFRPALPQLLDELSHWPTRFISAQDILETHWEADFSLLIIPGGMDIPYHNSLQGEGNRRIRRFVEEGGAFLGICAGAYYGCKSVAFDLNGKLEVAGERELAFFPGTAYGPAYGTGTFFYNSQQGARASLISDHLKCYYNGGCYFDGAASYEGVNVHSRYLDIEGEPAAIISMQVGKGNVVLSGVHIESSPTYLPRVMEEKMAEQLMPFETKRRELFQSLLRLLDLPKSHIP